MVDITIVKKPDGTFEGLTEQDQAAYAKYKSKLKNAEAGEVINFKFSLVRNPLFHRKFFALLNLGFEHWEMKNEGMIYNGQLVIKNFDNFREHIIILSGFYDTTFDIKGNLRLLAKSISFANMDEAEFEQLYSKVLDTLLGHVFKNYAGRAEVDEVIEKIMRFV